MKKFYHTLAVAAVAAVSLFSAQSAHAQFLSMPSAVVINTDTEEEEPILTSSESNANDDGLMDELRQIFLGQLQYYKENNTLLTKQEALNLLKIGRNLGLSNMDMMTYLTNIAPY